MVEGGQLLGADRAELKGSRSFYQFLSRIIFFCELKGFYGLLWT